MHACPLFPVPCPLSACQSQPRGGGARNGCRRASCGSAGFQARLPWRKPKASPCVGPHRTAHLVAERLRVPRGGREARGWRDRRGRCDFRETSRGAGKAHRQAACGLPGCALAIGWPRAMRAWKPAFPGRRILRASACRLFPVLRPPYFPLFRASARHPHSRGQRSAYQLPASDSRADAFPLAPGSWAI